MTEQQLRKQVVAIAQGWLDCKESDGSHKKIIDLYNSHKPLARGYKVKYSDAWCATTVSAVFIKAGLTDIAPTECSCAKMIELYKKIGRWKESDSYKPSAGDLVMYDWDDDGKGDNTGHPEHVGLVVSVANGNILVIEGNKNNSVGYRNLNVNGKYIRGFCLPKYTSKASEEAPKKSSSAVAPARSKDKSVRSAVVFKVTASALNVRSSASSTSSKNILKTIPKGTNVVWYGYYTDSWYLVQLPDKHTGYVHKNYIAKA